MLFNRASQYSICPSYLTINAGGIHIDARRHRGSFEYRTDVFGAALNGIIESGRDV